MYSITEARLNLKLRDIRDIECYIDKLIIDTATKGCTSIEIDKTKFIDNTQADTIMSEYRLNDFYVSYLKYITNRKGCIKRKVKVDKFDKADSIIIDWS